MRSTVDKGRSGEDAALEFLLANGYVLLERNYRQKFGEIDIVAQCDSYLCFVEVKMREDAESVPQEAVSCRKKGRLIRAAYAYLLDHKLDPFDTDCRFDVLAVWLCPSGEYMCELFANAFTLDEV